MSAVRAMVGTRPVPPRLPWRAVHLNGQSFIYTETGAFLCVVTTPSAHETAQAKADFIIRACHHHDELVRLVKAAIGILSDGLYENAVPVLGISTTLMQEFSERASAILQMAQPGEAG